MELHREVDSRTPKSVEQSRPIEISKIINPAKGSLRLGSLGAVMACAIAGPGYAQGRSVPTLPECTQAGQRLTLDLSTGTTNGNANAPGVADPEWRVLTVPPTSGLTAPLSPFSIPAVPGWANATAPATWIEPWPGTTANPSTVNGLYQYAVDFNIPHPLSSYTSISIAGQCRADDGAALTLNSSPVQNCGPFIGPGTGGQPLNFSFTGPAFFQPGPNAFRADVQNTGGGPTGLMVSATLTAVCAIAPTGILKVCKVAGPGIAVGTPFSFTANGNPFQVPAGPGPGGTCVIGPSFAAGTTVNVVETIPPGVAVSNIAVAVAPPGSVVSTNLATGTASVIIGNGVTQATFTDYRTTGYLEICKTGTAAGSFMVNPGNLGPFAVPLGACTPAIQVTAGPVVITETPNAPGTSISGCTTFPSGRLVSCPTGGLTATVTVVPGDIPSETIVTVNNARIRDPGSPAQ